ncbi:ABC transporter ATP-binding protein [Bacillus marinisedimentorum]|uniref:ABC transporter ATP-binding protein n=1 Tax=Bacillus marinisedimentorum TaxID=1821260 RepID=UPI000871E971|nr:ABC transporter ATP-binding protein [Bacillus marinisedimentorum]
MSLLKAERLVKSFNGQKVLDDLELTIEEGSCTALLGPNGAGKTTTLNILTGLLEKDGGRITFKGQEGGDFRSAVGYLPQYPAFYPWMTGKEFLQYAAELCGIPKREAQEKSSYYLEMFGLADAGAKKTASYSGGMKQRLGLAQAIIHDPKLLIMDEPVSSLDPIGRYEVLDLIRKLKKKTTILFSTHILHDAEEVSDDVYIIAGGKNVLSGPLHELRRSQREPVIVIESADDLNELVASWEKRNWAGETNYHEGKARLVVSDVSAAQKEILEDIAATGKSLQKFEAGQTTLEDVFLKMVTGK